MLDPVAEQEGVVFVEIAVIENQQEFAAVRIKPLDRMRSAPCEIPEIADADVIDVAGTYSEWFAQLGRTAVLGRPDFFVFGSSADAADTAALVMSLRDQLAGVAAADTAKAPAVGVSV